MLVRPHLSGHPHARLHLVDDKHRLVFIGKLAQRPEELPSEVVVPPLSLDRLDDDRGDVILVLVERLFDLTDTRFLVGDDAGEVLLVQRIADCGVEHPGPRELREQVGFDRIGVRQRKRVAGTAVKRLPEVNDLPPPFFPVTMRPVLPNFPIKCRLQGVLDRQGTPLDEKSMGKRGGHRHPRESVDELRLLRGVNVRQRRLVDRDIRQFLQEGRGGEFGMVHPQGG